MFNNQKPSARKHSVIEGVKALGQKKHYVRRGGKKLAKLALGGLGAVAFGTIGLAAGISTGDFSKAATYAGAGMVAGKKVGEYGIDKITGIASDIKDDYNVFRKGYEGTEYEQKEAERQNKKFLKDPEAIEKYRANFGDYKGAMEMALEFRRKGITDDEKIISSLKIIEEERRIGNDITVDKMINVVQLEGKISDTQYTKNTTRKKYKKHIEGNIYNNLQARTREDERESASPRNKEIANQNASDIMRLIGRLKEIDIDDRDSDISE